MVTGEMTDTDIRGHVRCDRLGNMMRRRSLNGKTGHSDPDMAVPQEWEDEMTSEAICAAALQAAPRIALLRHPIFRKIYLTIVVLTALCILLPSWAIWYSLRSNRPRRTWTVQRCLRVRWSRLLCGLVARCEIDYLGRDLDVDLDPSSLTHSHPVDIQPAPQHWLKGHPAQMMDHLQASKGIWIPKMVHRRDPKLSGTWGRWNEVNDVYYGFDEVKGFWFAGQKQDPNEQLAEREPGEPVGLHFHGGGYICGTAAETDLTSSIPKTLVGHSPIHRILSVDYRLAPKYPWPIPLLDAISAYHYLVYDQQIDERDIVIFGDSAGGHLALALTRYLRDEGKALGLRGPRALVLMSPWVDIGFTSAWGEAKWHNASSDLIDDTFGPFATSLLLRAVPIETMHTSSYLSPAGLLLPPNEVDHLFDGFPPIFTVYGGAERLSSSIDIFWSRLSNISKREGDKLVEGPDCVHDFMIFPWQEVEAAVVYGELDVWLRDLLSQDDDIALFSPASGVLKADSGVALESPTVFSLDSPMLPLSPIQSTINSSMGTDWEALARRRNSRIGLKSDKSPVIAPRTPGVGRMVRDMRTEAMTYLPHIPPMDLDKREWLTPFTAQMEKGEWDWELDEDDNDERESDHGSKT